MTATPRPRPPIVDLGADDPAGPPRNNGELVFDAPWQGRAFGMCVAVLDRQGLGWDDFRPHLVAAIANRPEAGYYEAFAEALDAFLMQLGLVGPPSEEPARSVP